MVARGGPGRKARVPYKVVVSLFPHEWDELQMEAQARHISGGELIGALLSHYIKGMDGLGDVPPPSEPPEDA